jgi:hypothetical protein
MMTLALRLSILNQRRNGLSIAGGTVDLRGRTKIERLKIPLGSLSLSLCFLVSSASFAGCSKSGFPDRTAAQTQPSQHAFNLGRIWKVEEGYYDEAHWVGVWTRRGESNVFDAVWKHCWTRETAQDVVEVQLAKDGQLTVFRRSIKQHYRGRYSAQHPNKVRGGADWYGPDLIWKAEIE